MRGEDGGEKRREGGEERVKGIKESNERRTEGREVEEQKLK